MYIYGEFRGTKYQGSILQVNGPEVRQAKINVLARRLSAPYPSNRFSGLKLSKVVLRTVNFLSDIIIIIIIITKQAENFRYSPSHCHCTEKNDKC